MSKYNAKPIEFEGIRFDSIAEYRRYGELKLLEQAGEISGLVVHPRYLLQPAFKYNGKVERKIEYEGDFQYQTPDGWTVVEDVKSPATRTQVYMVKRKLFLAKYPDVKFVEVMG